MAKRKKEPMIDEARMRLEIENKVLKEMLLARGNVMAEPVEQVSNLPSPAPKKERMKAPKVSKFTSDDPNADVDWTKVVRKCSGPCGETKAIDPFFGPRKVRGVTYGQSQCKACRSLAARLALQGPYKRKRAYVKRGSTPKFDRKRSYSPREN